MRGMIASSAVLASLAGGLLRADPPVSPPPANQADPAPAPDESEPPTDAGRPTTPWRRLESDLARSRRNAEAEIFDRLAAPVLESVRRAPKDEAGLQALEDLLPYCVRLSDTRTTAAVLRLVADNYAESAAAAPFLGRASQHLTAIPASAGLLERVVAANPNRVARAAALWTLAEQARQRVGTVTGLSATQLAAQKKAKGLYDRVVADYGDVVIVGSKPIRERAKSVMAQLFVQPIGEPLPGLAGPTPDGTTDTLERHKGKVVVLDLWRTTCGPCVAMIPDQRAMAERFKGRPFVMISVNLDADKKTFESFLETHPMPWTHWWWGADGIGADKPATPGMFRTNFFPNILVIDAAGVVRFKQVRGQQLTDCVETCLKELTGTPPK